VEFEWDERKRNLVIEERKVDFLYSALIFEGQVLTGIDDRQNYGEVREISVGLVGGECFVVVHTNRNGVIRLITSWKGGHEEHDQYQKGIDRSHQEDEGGGEPLP